VLNNGAGQLVRSVVDACCLCCVFEDYMTQEAAKILRLLHIRELRELQTIANEAIIAVQSLTANPKTDTKLGKVGI